MYPLKKGIFFSIFNYKGIFMKGFFSLLPALILFLGFQSRALPQKIDGLVMDDSTGEVLEGVNIYDPVREYGTVTDSEGKFRLKKVDPETFYSFSHIGYETAEYNLAQLEQTDFVVRLKQVSENLRPVTLAGQKLHDRLPYMRLQEMPKTLYAFSHAVLGNKIYITGGKQSKEVEQALKLMERYASTGFDEFLAALKRNPDMDWPKYNSSIFSYDLQANTWETEDVETVERAFHNSETVDGKIYTFGGKTLSMNKLKEYLPNKIEIFNPATGELLVDETNPHQAVNFASFSKDSLLFVAGGSTRYHHVTNRKDYSNQVHVYNSRTGYWKELGPMPEAKETTAIREGDKVYFVGGYHEQPLDFVEMLNLKNGKWNRLGRLFSPVEKPALAAKNGSIYIYADKRILVLDLKTNDLKEYRTDFDEVSPQMIIYKDHLYLFGGLVKFNCEENPSSNFYKIALSDFEKTRIWQEKNLAEPVE